MKLYYLFLLIMFFLMSCERTSNVSESRTIGATSGSFVFERTIEGHDYIKVGYGMAHSGTCRKCKQERDSITNLVIQKLDSIKKKWQIKYAKKR